MPTSSYEIPAFGGPGDRLNSWLLEAVAEGDIWLRAQKPTQEWEKIIEVLGPLYNGSGGNVVGQSQTGYNRVRREFREIVATMSGFRHVGEFNTTDDDNQDQFQRAHMLTNLDEHWWRVTFAQLKIRDAMMYGVGKGTGYFYQDWDKSAWGPGRGDIRLRAFDASDVTFVQLPKSHEIQQAYMVLIREELPLNLAKRMYSSNPTFSNALRADRDAPGWLTKGIQRVQQFFNSPALNAAGQIRKNNDSFPTVDIWHAYTMDGSINQGSGSVQMGADGTNWNYTVPSLGSPLGQGIRNPATGQEWTLPAGPDDCLLFPLRRLTIFSRTGVAYDGTSPWWHGDVPVARIRFNDLPWEALGASQVGDARTMQDGLIAMMRGMEDSAAARMDPPGIYDDTRVDKAWADAFNPRKAGVRAAADLSQGNPIVFPVPTTQYDIPQWMLQLFKDQEARMDYVTMAQDLTAIAKAGQIPSSDTLEKLLEMAGPGVQDMVSSIVEPFTRLGDWRKAYYFQFYTKQRMLQIADPTGIEQMQNVKYMPDRLVPNVANELPAQRTARIRSYLSDFRYDVTESGLTELNRMSRLLLYIQLSKSGALPISWWTMAKAARVPNYGPAPTGTNTELERVIAQKHIETEMQVEAAKDLQQAQNPDGGGGAAEPPPSGAGPGRPQTFQQSPQLVNKPGEGRSTISTGKR